MHHSLRTWTFLPSLPLRGLCKFSFLCCTFLLVTAAFAENPVAPPFANVENPPILSLNKIERGQKGIGYTVFASARGAEPFGFEILGVMRGYLGPGEDLIIAKLTGEQIERTGVISGMSGSPAYVDGKLIGAVGYRFGSFTKDAIAGITPIERMLAVADANPALPSPAKSAPSHAQQSPWGTAIPISTPVIQSGLHPEVIKAFEPYLKARGMWPLLPAAGASGGSKVSGKNKKMKRSRLFAGGPIAGLMVDGDVNMAGIGTVTWVHGDRFLAFGHPFQGIGTTNMPVSDAEIVTTVASEAGSWKMGQATKPVGRLTDDRLHAIAGDMGIFPKNIPVEVDLQLGGPRHQKDARKLLRYSVMQHPSDTPLYIAIALANAIESRISAELGGTLEVRGKVLLSTGDVMPIHARSSGKTSSPGLPSAISVLNHLSELTEHRFQDVSIENVKLTLSRTEEVFNDVITGVRAIDTLYPGKNAKVAVRVAQFEKAPTTQIVKISLPKGLAPGRYTLVATSSRRSRRLEREAGLLPVAATVSQHFQNISRRAGPGTLSLYLVRDNKGLFVGGRGLHSLPSSLRGILDESGGSLGRVLEVHATSLARVQRKGVLNGEARGKVIVRHPLPR
ncbi:MAG: hypothetical protein GY822_21615 [Deltaproteobacteria bacterium]|nr:hypothetical protein [Deltaproteobacteria bacterium]